MAWKKSGDPKKYKKGQIILTIILFAAIIIIGLLVWRVFSGPENVNDNQTVQTAEDEQQSPQPEEKEQVFDAIVLQNTVDSWVESISGTSSVVITDSEGNILAGYNPNQSYFAASIYKLYVAYAGYQQIDSGEVDRNEQYVNGYTRYECLDKMIRESYSPCAEKLWVELGKAELTEQLETYGLTNTSMEGITTSSADAAVILARIARGEDLSDESQAAYLSSMKDQEDLYRRGFPKGFNSLTVYNKVGWNEQKEWHDAAIVELPDGRRLIVSVFTENVGSSNIAKLGSAIEASLKPE